jgi:hypothetical protein
MSVDIITFEKSFQQRLTEYTDILCGRGRLPVSGIQNEWYYYIENVLEPAGWQAVWKISRQKCEEFKIQFPTIVIVMVWISFTLITFILRLKCLLYNSFGVYVFYYISNLFILVSYKP